MLLFLLQEMDKPKNKFQTNEVPCQKINDFI